MEERNFSCTYFPTNGKIIKRNERNGESIKMKKKIEVKKKKRLKQHV